MKFMIKIVKQYKVLLTISLLAYCLILTSYFLYKYHQTYYKNEDENKENKEFYANDTYEGFYYNFSPISLKEELDRTGYIEQLPKNPKGVRRIAIICKVDRLSCMRMQEGANSLGWESLLISVNTTVPQLILHPLDVTRIHGIVSQFNPDFTISHHNFGQIPATKNYFTLHFPSAFFNGTHKIDQHHCPKPFKYDGILTVTDKTHLSNYYPDLSVPVVEFKLARVKTDFVKVNYSRLFICGSNWDQTRRGPIYRKLYELLDKYEDVDIYGPKRAYERAFKNLKSYKGFIPYDDQLFIQAIRNSGMGLVLHSEGHLRENFPSSRLLEVVSSSALAIADEMPWVKETFGDTVLYIETIGKTAEEIYAQISRHIKWAKANPELAYEKAKAAHKIYLDNFTMEKMLQDVDAMHKKNSKDHLAHVATQM